MRAGNREFVARRNVYKQLAGYDGSWASKPEGEPLAGPIGKAPEGVNRWPAPIGEPPGASTAGRRANRWPAPIGEPPGASTAGRRANRWPARSANRLGVNRWPEGEPLAGGQGKAPEGEPLAGPIGNRLGVNRWPEGEPPGASTAKRKQKGRHYRPDQPDAYIRPS
jgi:hypothetical protein